jgi:hypothetical protein
MKLLKLALGAVSLLHCDAPDDDQKLGNVSV